MQNNHPQRVIKRVIANITRKRNKTPIWCVWCHKSARAQTVSVCSRPDIAFSGNKVCQFMSRLLEYHWKAVKILRYLKGTITHGLLQLPHNRDIPFSLRA